MRIQIIVCGVGGQGIVFTTRVLAETALQLGHEIIGSETIGMSQRGGAVASHLKVGGFGSPLVRRGAADVLLALDAAEAYRMLDFLREDGMCFVNVPDGRFPDPAVQEFMAQRKLRWATLNADAIALELGTAGVANAVMLGFLAAHDVEPFTFEPIAATIERLAGSRRGGLNQAALERGREAAQVREKAQ